MRLRKTHGERLRSARLKTLPPLALEFSRIMGDVFGDKAKTMGPEELKVLRAEAAALANRILEHMDHLRWDQGVTPEMRLILAATRRKMLTDKRIKGLLNEAAARPAPP